ncbi:MAG: HsdM family class I SAM-dependent methyltransferase [Candidatus Oxydemutatoraceae bacterium WSBS_2016_MAG_OTU14]
MTLNIADLFLLEIILKMNKMTYQRYLKNWKFIGVAFSGEINNQYKERLNTFAVEGDQTIDINEDSVLDDYIAHFESIDLESIATNISKSSKKINNLLRNLDSQRRPVLLSSLMICMYPKDDTSNFKNTYQSYTPQTLIGQIKNIVSHRLKEEGIDKSRVDIFINELHFIDTDRDLTTSGILQEILKELESNVIPLFEKGTAYDIIGKFYEEFLRYAGIANVKKGIVLTPHHITTLFSELIDIKTNDVIFDPACGTGAFLIAAMNKLIDTIKCSNLSDKEEKITNIKTKQLVGIEKSTTMFTLAISNMLFRGDGKPQIFNEDFFSPEADGILKKLKPTIGFVNPPFGGKNNKKSPTPKEIQFLEKLLDSCSRYVVIIAPLSTYFKDDVIRTRILTKHSLKYVINMPTELFQPNAMTHTAIAVFETNSPHTQNHKVVFYDLKKDGFVLSKNKGRTDPKNKWNFIKKDMLNKITNPAQHEDSINLVYKTVTGEDEWIIQAHSKMDYSDLSEEDFLKNIRKYVVFKTKKDLGLLNGDMDDLAILEILSENKINAESVLKNENDD